MKSQVPCSRLMFSQHYAHSGMVRTYYPPGFSGRSRVIYLTRRIPVDQITFPSPTTIAHENDVSDAHVSVKTFAQCVCVLYG